MTDPDEEETARWMDGLVWSTKWRSYVLEDDADEEEA